jgi:hypothetical protein
MSCCGQKRLALAQGRAADSPSRTGASPVNTRAYVHGALPHNGDVRLRYLGSTMFSTRSAHTGRAYRCSGTGERISVDRRDADSLLRMRLFTRV